MQHFRTPTPQSTLRRRLTTYLVALTGACLAMLPQGLYAHDSLSFPVPAKIEVPEGHRPFLRGHAVGTQNYMCLHCPSSFPSPSPCSSSGFAWSFVGPQATLFNANGTQIITHFLSPPSIPPQPGRRRTRKHAPCHMAGLSGYQRGLGQGDPDSSDPNFVEPGAIPWLLLEVVGSGYGPTGGSRLTATKYIQRVNTKEAWRPAAAVTRTRTWASGSLYRTKLTTSSTKKPSGLSRLVRAQGVSNPCATPAGRSRTVWEAGA